MEDDEFIVSKTDGNGKILYTNRVFMQLSGYTEKELLGQQHSMIRHPDMPHGLFHHMWDTLKQGNEFIGFLKNLCKDGSHYWVFAHITPDHDANGNFRGYYSVRRKPCRHAITTICHLYDAMNSLEQTSGGRSAASLSARHMHDYINEQELSYDEFILQLDHH
ncbi:MAG: PAS domain-containing protein [Marinobacterium sp.]|nr:PAS domain-containing protein [Marinobacterium sp.]